MMDLVLITAATVLTVPIGGGLISGLDRILTARLQARIGPPIAQPFYDVIKLLGKEPVVVNVWQGFCAYSYLSASVIAVVLFALRTDLLLILFIQAVGGIFLVVGALSSTSPYSQVGAHRELLQVLSYEPLFILVTIGFYLQTGTFTVSGILAWNDPLLLKLPFLFVALSYAMTIKLRKSPLDLSTSHHGHQEIVKGLLTDYSGPHLAFIEIGHWFDVILLLGWCSLFWATSWIGIVLIVAAAYSIQIVVDNASARMNWRWMLKYVWSMGLTLSIVNLIWVHVR